MDRVREWMSREDGEVDVLASGMRRTRAMTKFIVSLSSAIVKHDIASLASVIAFYGFFALFPLILLIIYAGSLLLPMPKVELTLLRLIHPYFPALPDAKLLINKSIEHLSQVGANVGLVSAVTLTWSATSGFIAVQQAMEIIWECEEQRSFVMRRLIAFGMLVLLLLITMGSAIAMVVYPALSHLPLIQAQVLHLALIVHVASRVLFPLSLFLGFVVFYRYLPMKTVNWEYVIPGALLATVAIDLGRELFVWYAGHLVTYQLVYGSLTVVMLLILWIYIASMVMLFGAEFSATLHKMRSPEDFPPPKDPQ